MLDTNWDLLKFKYEVLGISIKKLAIEHSVSEPVLKFNSQTWKQIPLAAKESMDLKDITSLEDILVKLGSETASQTKAFAILKQKFLGPKYIELETILLHKAIEMASEIPSNDPRAARTLKSLVEVLRDLLTQNPLLISDNKPQEGEATEWRITVVEPEKKEEK